jgi:hypothetical protein
MLEAQRISRAVGRSAWLFDAEPNALDPKARPGRAELAV